jgi:hypothetical protein
MIASGLALPARRITVNLAPADLPNASETALSGKPDDGERRHPRRYLHLHVDRPDLDALERHRRDALDHVRPCPRPHSS